MEHVLGCPAFVALQLRHTSRLEVIVWVRVYDDEKYSNKLIYEE